MLRLPEKILDGWTERVEINGKYFDVRFATLDDIPIVKSLDDLCFLGQHGSSLDELNAVYSNGIIVLFQNGERLAAMSQIVLSDCSILSFRLASKEMFSYGSGIHPEFRGSGLSSLMMAAQKMIARYWKKSMILSTTRIENARSLMMRFRAGYQLISFLPRLFPDEGMAGDRVLLRWIDDQKPHLAHQDKTFSASRNPSREGIGKSWFVPVKFGEQPDQDAHDMIATAIRRGYVGVCLANNSDGVAGIIFNYSDE